MAADNFVQGTDAAGERRFTANQDAPRAARDLVRERCAGLDDHSAANLYLAVSELVTNAVVHGPRADITVRVLRRPHDVRIEVYDQGRTGFEWPEPRSRNGERPHGLELVEAFSDRCGVAIDGQTMAWCELDLAA